MAIQCFMVVFTGNYGEWKQLEGGGSVKHGIWRRMDTGEEFEDAPMPVGAMWYADDEDRGFYPVGPDGKSLFVMTPGGPWNIDGRAQNCTMPDDDVHRCWIRHGTPPNITVDQNGNSCNAGAGSIMSGDYHGFLQNGQLT